MRPRIVVAPSGFKESLSAREAAEAMAAGARRALPEAELIRLPLVDGGEGFAEALVEETGGMMHERRVTGPFGEKVTAAFGMLGGERPPTAVIEAASAIGLRLVPREARDPLRVDSRGVGELISHALDLGAEHLIIGCGDTANNDGGFGLASALGARFLDRSGEPLAPGVSSLADLSRIDLERVDPRLVDGTLEVACNPYSRLVGPNGTSRVFGPYKGATPEAVIILDAAIQRVAEVIERTRGVGVSDAPGAGAGGGMGASLHGLFGATLTPRYEIVLAHLPLEASLRGASLVLTGEGSVDETTLLGKVPIEVAGRAAKHGVPVVALCGERGPRWREVLVHGIDEVVMIAPTRRSVEEALRHAKADLEAATEAVVRRRLGE